MSAEVSNGKTLGSGEEERQYLGGTISSFKSWKFNLDINYELISEVREANIGDTLAKMQTPTPVNKNKLYYSQKKGNANAVIDSNTAHQ